jgi:hypothetical protein
MSAHGVRSGIFRHRREPRSKPLTRRAPGLLRGPHDNQPFTMPMNPGRVSRKKFTPQVPLYLCCLVIPEGKAVITVQLGHSA